MIIALHGDFASPGMLKRDMGDFPLEVAFFDAKRWLNFDAAMGRLVELVTSLPEPPIDFTRLAQRLTPALDKLS